MAFTVAMVTSSLLWYIILCPEKRNRVKTWLKGVIWMVLTMLEQSVEFLKCRERNIGNKNEEKKKEERINWLVVMETWLLFGMWVVNFYKCDMYSYLSSGTNT